MLLKLWKEKKMKNEGTIFCSYFHIQSPFGFSILNFILFKSWGHPWHCSTAAQTAPLRTWTWIEVAKGQWWRVLGTLL